MKNMIIGFTAIGLCLQALASTGESPVDHLFVPEGFDNNDNVELIVSGAFPSDCYSRNKVETSVSGSDIHVKVTSIQNGRSNCTALKIPYTENITLGTLQGGRYAVKVNGLKMGSLKVLEAPSESVDDHVYAKIDYVELGFTGGLNGSAFLIGKNVADCVELDEVKYISNGSDTISILPIMKKLSGVCNETRSYLEIPIKVDLSQMRHSKTLLFVRTMDGKSVHGLIER